MRARATNYLEVAMKALILYVVFVVIGGLIATGIGYYVEIEFSSAASLVVFLALFFANFVVSWIAVVLVMDGTLKDAQGRQSQLDIERSGQRAMNGRAPTRIGQLSDSQLRSSVWVPGAGLELKARLRHACGYALANKRTIPRAI